MAGFVDCGKYNKDQEQLAREQAAQDEKLKSHDKKLDELDKREIVHDATLEGGGIDSKDPLKVAASTKADNAIKTGEEAGGAGVYVKDLEPQVNALEKALQDTKNRLGNDLEARLRDLNGKLNNLKDVEVALAAAKAEGNYNKIKELEARLQAAKEAQQAGDKGLADAIEALRKQGLTDAEIQKIIADAIAKAGGTGRYITRIEPNQNDGTVTYYYSDGTHASGKLANFGGVTTDGVTISGNGNEQALKVKLSKQSGNMLEVRDDGIYYGQAPKADLSNLYVSNDGDDSNIGTREKPLRTIQAAVDRTENQQVLYHIHLHENHEFDWVYSNRGNASYIFSAYGDLIDSQYPDYTSKNAYYRGYAAKDYPRPVINVRVQHRNARITRMYLIAERVTFRGVRLNVWNKFEGQDSKDISGSFTGAVDCKDLVQIHGCVVERKSKAVFLTDAGAYRDDMILRGPRIMWIDSRIIGDTENFYFASSNYTTQISLVLWNSGHLHGYGEKPDHEALIPSGDYATAGKGIASNCHQVIINDTDKYVLGINFNYDVFSIK
nr:MAG TPA: asparaginyl-tRNA synthetase [Bacteriophage sp.]